jgi:nicotinamidase-related amidase
MKSIIITSALLVVFLVATVTGYVFLRLKGMSTVSTGTSIPEYKEPKKALLVIDIQRDLTEKGGKHVINPGQSDLMVSNTNKIIDQFEKSGDLIIYVRHHNKMDLLVKLLVNGALEKGSNGAKFDRRLKIIGKNIIEKKIGDAFSNPDLDSILQRNKINQIYMTGMVVEQCVDKTLKAAVNRNYRVVAVKDAMTSVSDKKRNEKIKEFAAMGAEIKMTHGILEHL